MYAYVCVYVRTLSATAEVALNGILMIYLRSIFVCQAGHTTQRMISANRAVKYKHRVYCGMFAGVFAVCAIHFVPGKIEHL